MEIKITADKKLLEAIDKLAEAIKGLQLPQIDAMTALPVVVEEEPAQDEKPLPGENKAVSEDAPETPAEPIPTRDDVRRVAIVKIQGGHRDAVTALVKKYGGTRVQDVPEANLVAFKAELEALA